MRNSPIIIYINGEFVDPFEIDKIVGNQNGRKNSVEEINKSIARWIKSDKPNVPFIVWYNSTDDSSTILKLLREYYVDEDLQLGDNLTDYSIDHGSIFGKNIIVW